MIKKSNNNKTKQRSILSFILCFSLILGPSAFAQEASSVDDVHWLFPGDILPGEKSILPMTVGTGSGYDISLAKRDWFLLEPAQSVYSFQAQNLEEKRGALGYVGPKLKSYNAQMYYRLATGMILKETMKQMGLNSIEARRYFDSAAERGLDFDTASLEEMGELPAVLKNLYINFKRPIVRHALLPYLIAPLAIADHQSQFRHFLETKNKSSFKEVCTNIKDMKPISWVQDKINEKQTEINDLDRAYSDAGALLKQSSLEKVRLTGLLKDVTEETRMRTLCLNSLKNRVNRGSNLPIESCLKSLEAVMTETKNEKTFEKFKKENLSNDEGDFVSKEKKKTLLEDTEKKISVKERSQIFKTKRLEDVQAALASSEKSWTLLKAEEKNQIAESDRLSAIYGSVKEELSALQQLNFDLDQGRFQADHSAEETSKAIANTPVREARISELKAQLPKISQQQEQIQRAKDALSTQVGFLSQKISSLKLDIEAFKNPVAENIEQTMEELLAEKTVRAQEYKVALDKFNFSEFVISLFSQKVFNLETEKNDLFSKLENEKIAHAEYELKVAEVKNVRSEQVAQKKLELAELSNQVSAYRSVTGMGWYLKQACKEESSSSVFLSRSTIDEDSLESAAVSKDGKWGLFNLSYRDYKNSLDRGLALNLPLYIDFSVRKMIEHYDFMNQSLFSNNASCNLLGSGLANASVNQIVGTFSMWAGDDKSSSDNRGFCDLKSQKAQNFEKSLLGLTLFKGSLLDQVLPKVGVHSAKITLEREALYWLTNEFQIMTQGRGDNNSIEERREGLIKSLIRVLANDYKSEIREEESDKEDSLNIQLASTAPSSELYKKVDLPVGSTQVVKTIGKVSLYTAPLAESEYKAGIELSLNDLVEILPISKDTPDVSVKAKWVRVKLKSEIFKTTEQAFWMPAWPLTYGQFVSATGEPIYKFSKDMHCPVKRLVEEISNFKNDSVDGQVTRLLPEIKTITRRSGLVGMDWKKNKKTKLARTKSRTYVACEMFSQEGKKAANLKEDSPYLNYKGIDYSDVQGIRILEVKKITDVNGKDFYVPVEEYGGFAHAWILSRNAKKPRVILGEALDKDWSVVE